MTDKQIIINGIDVSGCKHYKNRNCIADYCLTDMPFSETKCELNTNCYYKQLKRKEQECEEFRQYHNKCCTEFENEKQELLEKYNQISRDFYNGKYCNKEKCSLLKAKEQECEELKRLIAKQKNAKIQLSKLKDKQYKEFCDMKQTLTEIKETLKDICIEECSFNWEKPCPDCDCRYNNIIEIINKTEEMNNDRYNQYKYKI